MSGYWILIIGLNCIIDSISMLVSGVSQFKPKASTSDSAFMPWTTKLPMSLSTSKYLEGSVL